MATSEPTSDSEALLTTIDDYLLSIADGIALAQTRLARLAAQGPPGQQFSYYLPKLDFELRMTINVVQSSSLDRRYESYRADRPDGRLHMTMAPISNEQQAASSFSAEILSVIKGSFVAVPANDGLPPVVLGSQLETNPDSTVTLTVTARSGAGESLAGVEVQFNIDREESSSLSAEQGVSPVWTDTALSAGVVSTDAQGRASTILTVGPSMPVGAQLALVLDAAGRTELIVYEVR